MLSECVERCAAYSRKLCENFNTISSPKVVIIALNRILSMSGSSGIPAPSHFRCDRYPAF